VRERKRSYLAIAKANNRRRRQMVSQQFGEFFKAVNAT